LTGVSRKGDMRSSMKPLMRQVTDTGIDMVKGLVGASGMVAARRVGLG
jgi:hypothetical protein